MEHKIWSLLWRRSRRLFTRLSHPPSCRKRKSFFNQWQLWLAETLQVRVIGVYGVAPLEKSCCSILSTLTTKWLMRLILWFGQSLLSLLRDSYLSWFPEQFWETVSQITISCIHHWPCKSCTVDYFEQRCLSNSAHSIYTNHANLWSFSEQRVFRFIINGGTSGTLVPRQRAFVGCNLEFAILSVKLLFRSFRDVIYRF